MRALGDPILTGLDAALRSVLTSKKDRTTRNERLALEKEYEPDRLYDGQWAGLAGVDYVVVATLQTTTLDVLRKGVSYELPPLRKAAVNPPQGGHHRNAGDRTAAEHHRHES